MQAQEGDDKLGRQLRGADGPTLILVESARAQVRLSLVVGRVLHGADGPTLRLVEYAVINA